MATWKAVSGDDRGSLVVEITLEDETTEKVTITVPMVGGALLSGSALDAHVAAVVAAVAARAAADKTDLMSRVEKP